MPRMEGSRIRQVGDGFSKEVSGQSYGGINGAILPWLFPSGPAEPWIISDQPDLYRS